MMYGRDHITLQNTDPCKTQHPQLDPDWANVCGKTVVGVVPMLAQRCKRWSSFGTMPTMPL